MAAATRGKRKDKGEQISWQRMVANETGTYGGYVATADRCAVRR
jgi:hypothetical protein